jgi:hypothetical protein
MLIIYFILYLSAYKAVLVVKKELQLVKTSEVKEEGEK